VILRFYVDAFYHYWKKSVVSLKMVLYWTVTRNRIRAIPCDWEQDFELILHLLEAAEHLGERQSLCYLHPTFWGKRWKGERAATCCHRIKKKSAALQRFLSWLAGGSTEEMMALEFPGSADL